MLVYVVELRAAAVPALGPVTEGANGGFIELAVVRARLA